MDNIIERKLVQLHSSSSLKLYPNYVRIGLTSLPHEFPLSINPFSRERARSIAYCITQNRLKQQHVCFNTVEKKKHVWYISNNHISSLLRTIIAINSCALQESSSNSPEKFWIELPMWSCWACPPSFCLNCPFKN